MNRIHLHDFAHLEHDHLFDLGNRAGERNTWRVVALTAIMMAGEIVAGWLFNSMALLADGWHMGTHAFALGIAGFAYLFARKYSADTRFAFGTWKIEILGSFASAMLLGVVAIGVTVESAARLFRPVAIQYDYALWVAAAGLIVNIVSAFLLQHGGAMHGHDHAHEDMEHHHGDLNLKSAYTHVLADAFTSVLAIVALIGAKLGGWNWLDPVVGIVGCAVIAAWSYQLIRQTSTILLDREMDHPVVDKVKQAIESDGDAKVFDLHLWRVGRERFACVLSLVADHPHAPDDYRNRLRAFDQLAHVSIEVNPCPSAESARSIRGRPT
jgi:cation diffusion facilitator family transporter